MDGWSLTSKLQPKWIVCCNNLKLDGLKLPSRPNEWQTISSPSIYIWTVTLLSLQEMQDNSWRDAFKAKFKPRSKVFKNSSHVSCIEGFKFGKHLPTAAQLFEPFNFGGIHKSFCDDDDDPQRVRETIIVQAVANLLINQNYPDSGKPLVKIILILHQQHMDNFPLYILFWSWWWF